MTSLLLKLRDISFLIDKVFFDSAVVALRKL